MYEKVKTKTGGGRLYMKGTAKHRIDVTGISATPDLSSMIDPTTAVALRHPPTTNRLRKLHPSGFALRNSHI